MEKEEQQKLITELRHLTGLGMMYCKKALIYSDWDYDKAIEYLHTHDQTPMCITIK